MRYAHVLFAGALAAISAPAASAANRVFTFVITADVGVEWHSVTFEIRQPFGIPVNAGAFSQIQFVLDPSRHQTTMNPVDVVVQEPDRKAVRFDYTDFDPITSEDGAISFTVEVANPTNTPFRIVTIMTAPTPGAATALIAGLGFAASRRRRAV